LRVSVFGLGYVGVVTAACLARSGHHVVGVDVSQPKVDALNAGMSPLMEAGVQELLTAAAQAGLLSATADHQQAVDTTDLSLVSVGTPSRASGEVDLGAVLAVTSALERALARKSGPHTVVLRSTIPPGTTRSVVLPQLATRARSEADRVRICFNPEFLREGSSVADFFAPPYTVIGEAAPGDGDALAALYTDVAAPLFRCSLEVAEALKYTSNAFHGLKVAFANEMAVVFKSLGVDSHAVLQLACEDRKLNISDAYLRPGFAFGGSCLPKDLRAINWMARSRDLELPLLDSILPSNQRHLERALELVLATGERDVALLGLSFKAGTDDLRESPLVVLAERLLGKGYRLRIFDPDVAVGRLVGANRAYIEREIPHLGSLMTTDLSATLEGARVVVVGSYKGCDLGLLARWAAKATVIDLQRLPAEVVRAARTYHGICW
jgi:GDP-mannose 6-dehydrogenase